MKNRRQRRRHSNSHGTCAHAITEVRVLDRRQVHLFGDKSKSNTFRQADKTLKRCVCVRYINHSMWHVITSIRARAWANELSANKQLRNRHVIHIYFHWCPWWRWLCQQLQILNYVFFFATVASSKHHSSVLVGNRRGWNISCERRNGMRMQAFVNASMKIGVGGYCSASCHRYRAHIFHITLPSLKWLWSDLSPSISPAVVNCKTMFGCDILIWIAIVRIRADALVERLKFSKSE